MNKAKPKGTYMKKVQVTTIHLNQTKRQKTQNQYVNIEEN